MNKDITNRATSRLYTCVYRYIYCCVCVFASTYVNACLMNVTDKK